MIKTLMAQEMRVRDVMTRDVVAIPYGATVAQAGDILHAAAINGAPVTGSGGRVLGIVSRTDLVDPRHKHAPETPISEVMTRVVFAVRAEDPVLSAVRLMVEERVHRAIVTNDAGVMVGIVTPMDVLRTLVPKGAPDPLGVGFTYVDLRR
jgi:predicted transcriptional regulator